MSKQILLQQPCRICRNHIYALSVESSFNSCTTEGRSILMRAFDSFFGDYKSHKKSCEESAVTYAS